MVRLQGEGRQLSVDRSRGDSPRANRTSGAGRNNALINVCRAEPHRCAGFWTDVLVLFVAVEHVRFGKAQVMPSATRAAQFLFIYRGHGNYPRERRTRGVKVRTVN